MRGKRSVSERMSVDAEFGKPAESVGPQALSTKRTAPAPSLKSRTRFGSRAWWWEDISGMGPCVHGAERRMPSVCHATFHTRWLGHSHAHTCTSAHTPNARVTASSPRLAAYNF